MKLITLTTAALIAVAGVASAQSMPTLSSAAQVTLSTLAPNLDTDNLSSVQINRLNNEVGSDNGLSISQIRRIVAE